jgi:hypothetical protein
MSDWQAVAKGWDLKIPEDAVERIAPTLNSLEAAFRPLLAKVPFTLDPAVILSEKAVEGK